MEKDMKDRDDNDLYTLIRAFERFTFFKTHDLFV